jgi:hypothetical protein
MDGLMPGVPSDAKAAGWLAGQVLLHYSMALPLFCNVFVLQYMYVYPMTQA